MAGQPLSHPDNRELTQVFDTSQEMEAMVVQGLLDSAGIESLITARDGPQDVLPGVGGVVVRVSPEDADEALKVIEAYRSTAETEILSDDPDDPPA